MNHNKQQIINSSHFTIFITSKEIEIFIPIISTDPKRVRSQQSKKTPTPKGNKHYPITNRYQETTNKIRVLPF